MIENYIKISGDSYIDNYIYENGIATFTIIMENDKVIKIKIKSFIMMIKVSKNKDLAYRTCYFELLKLFDVLNIMNGVFVPPDNFSKLMNEKRNNLNLAYGLRDKEYEYIFSFVSGKKIASFIIKNKEDIEIQERYADYQ